MSKSNDSPNYNCLFRVTNDETHMAIIKEVRQMMKNYGTKWKLVVRGRKPKPNTGSYPYGSVPLENAQELGIYIYEKQELREARSNSRWQAIKKEREDYELQIKSLEYEREVLEVELASLKGLLLKKKHIEERIQELM